MIQEKEKLLVLKEVQEKFGIPGALCAIFNNIEKKWYYYIGELRLKNPNEGIYFNRILQAKCLNNILDNPSTYFSGESISNIRLLQTKLEELKLENFSAFEFEIIQF